MSVVSLSILAYALSGVLLALGLMPFWRDGGARVDVRLLLAGLALGSTGWADELWQVYGLYLLFGLGNSAVSIVTSTTLVTTRVVNRTSRAKSSASNPGKTLYSCAKSPIELSLNS